MKRKLSLLMALMMVVALLPISSFAASKASVATQVVSSDSPLTLNMVVERDGAIGFTSGGVFEIVLGPNAEFEGPLAADAVQYDVVGSVGTFVDADFDLRGTKVLEIRVPAMSNVNSFVIEAPVKLTNAAEGEQKVEVRNVSANVTNRPLTYALVSGSGNVIVRNLSDPATVTRSGDNQVQAFEIRETNITTFVNGSHVELRLPKDFTWRETTPGSGVPNVSTSLGTPQYKRDSSMNIMYDTIVIPVSGTNVSTIDRIVVNSARINVARNARLGNVDVEITSVPVGLIQASNFTRQFLTIAEYKEYDVTLKVDRVGEIIGGHVEDGREYEVLVTLEGNGDNSFLPNRDIKVTTSNGRVKLRTNPAPSQVASIVNKDGVAMGTSYLNEFYVQAAPNAEKIELRLYVRGNWNAGGKDLEFTAEGAGVEKQTVKIAEIKPAVTIETVLGNKAVADVVLGLQNQDAPQIVISETESGSLLEGSYIIDFPGQRFAGAQIMDLDFDVEGDIDVDVEISTNGDAIEITVERTSRTASTITIKDVKVTLDRTVPFGPLNARFGIPAGGPITGGYVSATDVTNVVSDIKYLNVVTEIQDARRFTTVFTLDSVTYTIDGEVRTLDAAPYISNNRTMLPIGTVAQLVGATVNYSPTSRTAVFTKDNLVVSMNLDTNILLVNGSPVAMDSKPEIVNSRAFVPVVYVAQAFGVQNGTDIVYDAATRTVTMFPSAQ